MKLLYELEDSIVGIIAAIFILIYAAQWSLKIPYFLCVKTKKAILNEGDEPLTSQ